MKFNGIEFDLNFVSEMFLELKGLNKGVPCTVNVSKIR